MSENEDKTIRIDEHAGDAVMSAWFAFERLATARTLMEQASAMVDLASHMSDVASWLPGYDPETGQVGEQP